MPDPSPRAAIVPATGPEWPALLSRVRHDVYHLPGYAALEAGEDTACAFTYEEGDLVFLVPLVLRRVPGSEAVDATSPYGYPGPVSDAPLDDGGFWRRAAAAMVAALAERGAVTCFVRLHPLLPPRLDALGEVGTLVQHGRTVVIDVTLPEEEQWSRTRERHRRYIRRAQRQGLVVTMDDWSAFDDFQEIYADTMDRVGASSRYRFAESYFTSLREALGDDLHLAVVEHEGRRVAASLLFEHDGIVQFHLGGVRSDALTLQPNKLETDHVRRWAAARGATAVHLGGGLGGVEDSIYHFKAGFSSEERPFFSWRVVVDRAEHDRLVASSGAPVATQGGFFPAYRAPS